MSKILFLSAESMSNAFDAIGRSFAPGFADYGHQVIDLNFATSEGTRRLGEILDQGDVLFALSFMGFGRDIGGTDPAGNAVNLWEATGIPFITLYGDTPAYYFDRHVMPSRNCASMYTFPEHLHFRKELPNRRGLLVHTPPGPMDIVSRSSVDLRVKESGRLLFLKNGNDPAKLLEYWRDALPAGTSSLLFELAAKFEGEMADSIGESIDHGVRQALEGRGIDADEAPELRILCFAQIDDYLRRVKSTLMANVLRDFPIDMYGENWDHVDFRGKPIRFTPGGNYERSGILIREALGMIDMSPNTGGAVHERVRRAFGTYTLCLTNRQRFLLEEISTANEFCFRFDPDALREKVSDVLAHPRRYVELGAATAAEFQGKFSWRLFAELLIDLASMIRFQNQTLPRGHQPYFVWPPEGLVVGRAGR